MRTLTLLFLPVFLINSLLLIGQTNLSRNHIIAQSALDIGLAAAEMDAHGNLYVCNNYPTTGPLVIHRLRPDGHVDPFFVQYQAASYFRMFPVADGLLWLTSGIDCDFNLPLVLQKIDTTGTVLWGLNFNELGLNAAFSASAGIMPLKDGSFWAFLTNEYPLHISPEGEVISTHYLPEPEIVQAKPISDTTTLTWGSSGITIYHKDLTWKKVALDSLPVTDAVVLDNGHVVVLSENNLLLLDDTLSLLKKLPLDSIAGFSQPIEVETTGSEVLILGNSGTEQVLCLLNQQLEAPSLVPLHDTLVFSDEHLSYFNGQLLITGLNGSNTLACSQRPIDAPQNAYTQDVSVIGLDAPDIYVTSPGNHAEWSDINVTISNLSMDTLQRVTLSSVMSKFTLFCPYYSDFTQTWEALNLPPGQSTALNIPHIDWGSIGIYSPNIQMCFTASLPNDSLDATPHNNRICKPFLQIIPVDEVALSPEFYLSPNPATSVLHLKLPENIVLPVQMTITNPFGQVMHEQNLSESVAEWPVHHWPSGYYTVHIRNGWGKVGSRPLIVQHER